MPQPVDARALGLSAVEALRRGDAAQARALFEKLIAIGGADAACYLGLAIACDHLGHINVAKGALDQALAREGNNLRALILRGDIAQKEGDNRTATAFYQAALRVAPRDVQLPQDVMTGLERAQAANRRNAEEYEAYLCNWFSEYESAGLCASGRFIRSLDLMFGKRQIYLQQPLFYYFPELPQIQFYERVEFPWLDAVEAATGDIRSELIEVMKDDAAFIPYVEPSPNRPSGDQMGLLGNPEWGAFFLWKNGTLVEENAARCPRTLDALKDVPLVHVGGRSPSVLFSLLKPGAKIPLHHGFVNTRLICHLPLIVPEGCGFRVGNDTRQWQEGKAWVFDDSIEHEAWNNSAGTRVILLFDIWRPELSEAEREVVTAMFQAIDVYGNSGEWNF